MSNIEVDNPHFDIPFNLQPAGTPVTEQDTFAEIANCIEVIIRTPYGFRDDTPDFGFEDVLFRNQPVLSAEIQDIVDAQEPRANIVLTEQPDFYDVLLDRITVEVSQ
jgi:hypothetical protein